ncbi:MAG: hypothetical protein P4L57_11400 [Rhizomicrobium sp.]|nr:hypothetical protein [Rhizomicrobium sp.]
MDEDDIPAKAPPTLTPWALCVAVLLGPAVLVWFVRLVTVAAGCTPGPQLCHGLAFGGGLRDTLTLAWTVSTNIPLLIALSILATLFAFRAFRPMLGTLTLLLLPVLSLLLPMLAVLFSRYEDCPVSSDAIGSCQLWGASMGMSFHNAALARDIIYAVVPYTFSLTVMLGVLGFFFARPRPQTVPHSMAHMGHHGVESHFGDHHRH